VRKRGSGGVGLRPRGASTLAARMLGAGAAILLALPSDAAAGPSHCAVGEQILFSCSTGQKTVSVCGSGDLSTPSGIVQYRFGKLGAPELLYPPANADWRKVTRGGVLTYAGGGGAYLVFSSAPYRYVVFTAIGRGWGTKAGVVVEKSGKRVATLACKAEETSELGPDLFARAAIPEDPGGFELP
jgi:hypothetical protein